MAAPLPHPLALANDNSKDPMGKHFVFTWNNPPAFSEGSSRAEWVSERWAGWQRSGAVWLICQMETGENGTEHLQGAISFAKVVRKQASRNMFRVPGSAAWVEQRRGSVDECVAYCSKEETRTEGPWEFGERPIGQEAGRKNLPGSKLKEIYSLLTDGASLDDIMALYPADFIRLERNIRSVWSRMVQKRAAGPRLDLKVIVLNGPTGCGKTRTAFDLAGGYDADKVFVVQKTTGKGQTVWWNGYESQPTVILDEFDDSWYSYKELLRVLDVHPYRCDTKGGFVWLAATTIIITSCRPPRMWYAEQVERAELDRRITEVRYLGPAIGEDRPGTPAAERPVPITAPPTAPAPEWPLPRYNAHYGGFFGEWTAPAGPAVPPRPPLPEAAPPVDLFSRLMSRTYDPVPADLALLPGRMSRIARAEAETEAAIEEFRNELSGSLSDVE